MKRILVFEGIEIRTLRSVSAQKIYEDIASALQNIGYEIEWDSGNYHIEDEDGNILKPSASTEEIMDQKPLIYHKDRITIISDDDPNIILVHEYWDCDCDENYIHHKADELTCNVCGR